MVQATKETCLGIKRLVAEAAGETKTRAATGAERDAAAEAKSSTETSPETETRAPGRKESVGGQEATRPTPTGIPSPRGVTIKLAAGEIAAIGRDLEALAGIMLIYLSLLTRESGSLLWSHAAPKSTGRLDHYPPGDIESPVCGRGATGIRDTARNPAGAMSKIKANITAIASIGVTGR